ncbi:hypothetical protein D3C80_1012560 [compost metagenome]
MFQLHAVIEDFLQKKQNRAYLPKTFPDFQHHCTEFRLWLRLHVLRRFHELEFLCNQHRFQHLKLLQPKEDNSSELEYPDLNFYT